MRANRLLHLLLLTACSRGSSHGDGRGTAPTKDDPTAKERAAARSVRVIAHRGASREAPENTLAAVNLAWKLGVDGVEIDVHLSRDGVPVVIHDDTTRRIGGVDRPVAAQTLAELQTLDVGAWKGDEFAGERIPTLAAVVATVPAGRTLFIEIKSEPSTVSAVLDALDPDAPVAFEGFDPAVLVEVKRHRPAARTYLLVGTEKDRATGRRLPLDPNVVARTRALGLTGLAVDYRGVTDDFRTALADAGYELYVWTVDDERAMAALASAGAAWMETNVPALAVRVFDDAPNQ